MKEKERLFSQIWHGPIKEGLLKILTSFEFKIIGALLPFIDAEGSCHLKLKSIAHLIYNDTKNINSKISSISRALERLQQKKFKDEWILDFKRGQRIRRKDGRFNWSRNIYRINPLFFSFGSSLDHTTGKFDGEIRDKRVSTTIQPKTIDGSRLRATETISINKLYKQHQRGIFKKTFKEEDNSQLRERLIEWFSRTEYVKNPKGYTNFLLGKYPDEDLEAALNWMNTCGNPSLKAFNDYLKDTPSRDEHRKISSEDNDNRFIRNSSNPLYRAYIAAGGIDKPEAFKKCVERLIKEI